MFDKYTFSIITVNINSNIFIINNCGSMYYILLRVFMAADMLY